MRSATRRQVVKGAFGIAFSLVSARFADALGAESPSTAESISKIPEDLEKKGPDEWIHEWEINARKNKDLQGSLRLQRFKDPMYILLNTIRWSAPKKGCCPAPVEVPKGFVTDFASVPRVFWSLFRADGDYAYAATLHDFLYWQQDRSKAEADSIFRYAMDDLKITDAKAYTLYKAVDLLGSSAWEANAKLRESGEKRVLKVFPSQPEITWAEWKNQPNIF